MKSGLALLLAVAVGGAIPAVAQRPPEHPQESHPAPHPAERSMAQAHPRANQGHPPPAPQARRGGQAEPERFDGGRVNAMPHVNHDRWYGHDRPDDPRFHLAHPYEHGRFAKIGPSYRYSVSRFDPVGHRFWLGSSAFVIAPFDYGLAADWCWNCDGDDFVVYDDPDHPGWYLLYNIHTGAYIHVQYGG